MSKDILIGVMGGLVLSWFIDFFLKFIPTEIKKSRSEQSKTI